MTFTVAFDFLRASVVDVSFLVAALPRCAYQRQISLSSVVRFLLFRLTAMSRDLGDYPIFLPTAGAITFNWPTSWANCSGYSDCAPSERALSGQLCTSTSRPSAPAAMAARPMGATFSRRPVPCDGSASIGKWESFLTIGMAEISIVLRV